MLDLGRLRVLRELKLRGTLGAVAEALGYTPSAVSQQLAQLQKDVGVPLVERVGRRLRLTEPGEVLAEHAEALLARAERAEEAALAASGRVAGVVRIVGFQTALLHVLGPALPHLAEAYPDLTLDVVDEEFHRVLHALVLQEIDVVLTDEYAQLPRPRRPELSSEVLITELMRVVLPQDHPLARDGAPVRMADLAGCSWASTHIGTNHADLIERACVEYGGFRPNVRYRSNDLLVVFQMVARGGAVCLVPDLAFAERQDGIVVRELADARLHRRMVLWTRAGADARPSVRVLLKELRRSADALVELRPTCVRGTP
ncbi:LysR family transcriptional regulator [Actinomadura spongiicola]|uniref:LysR family transcriptional regulator n=1 Tax=Actinomadura spongiicola TaxID=2303421 RepID=A0A372GLY7_9ACTN|nr:LysR family transcriptional regulator [Actinomadura spongiicola]RFS86407.1 LysR family transcriptional regulator [Actinomadura spongiicola]